MPDSGHWNILYRRSVRTSFFLVLLLVFVGGVVRSTGAGLGCPDWPKCFGLWIPPTSISQIPVEFWNHPLSSSEGKIIFNPIKTWIEYMNRLLGVIIGFSILIQAILALFSRSGNKARFWSLFSLFLVLFQGWLGSRVVSSDLRPAVISLHLLVALFIAISLLAALFFASVSEYHSSYPNRPAWFKPVVLATGFVLLIQFFLGTEVRSQVDALFREFSYEARNQYSGRLDFRFLIHRSFSLLALGLLFVQYHKGTRWFSVENNWILQLPVVLAMVLIISGIVLVNFDFPAFAQPFHLLLGLSIICAECWLVLHLFFVKKTMNSSD
jgi:cytochrome c oxidase assembly protein subunit 15